MEEVLLSVYNLNFETRLFYAVFVWICWYYEVLIINLNLKTRFIMRSVCMDMIL